MCDEGIWNRQNLLAPLLMGCLTPRPTIFPPLEPPGGTQGFFSRSSLSESESVDGFTAFILTLFWGGEVSESELMMEGHGMGESVFLDFCNEEAQSSSKVVGLFKFSLRNIGEKRSSCSGSPESLSVTELSSALLWEESSLGLALLATCDSSASIWCISTGIVSVARVDWSSASELEFESDSFRVLNSVSKSGGLCSVFMDAK